MEPRSACNAVFVLVITVLATPAYGQYNFSLTLFTRNSEVIELPLANASEFLTHPEFNQDLPTYIFFAGGTADPRSADSTNMTACCLAHGGYNCLLADWTEVSGQFYMIVVALMEDVAKEFAAALHSMVDAGYSEDLFYLVGHSLGGQLVGVIGLEYGENRIGRISAVDAVGIVYLSDPSLKQTSPASAKFVDAMHTDGTGQGLLKAIGHVDFYPNGGTEVQPGCTAVTTFDGTEDCNHGRSWQFFCESMLNEDAFLGIECSSEDAFNSGECRNNSVVRMGIATPNSTRGTYYLRTRGAAPFGLGLEGTQPA